MEQMQEIPSRSAVLGAHEMFCMFGQTEVPAVLRSFGPFGGLEAFCKEGLFGGLLANCCLGYRDLSLLAIAALSGASVRDDQISAYASAARLNGATEYEVEDALRVVMACAGVGAASAAASRVGPRLATAPPAMSHASKRIVRLADHDTLVWDSGGTGLPQEGVPMLLIHALNMDHSFWRDVLPFLASRGRVVAYDVRGHGHARGAPPSTSLDQLVGDIRLILAALGIEVCDVYGASYGGAIAQALAAGEPQCVRSMALLATWLEVPHKEHAARATDAEQHGMEDQVAKSMMRWFLPTTIAEDQWMIRYARNGLRRTRVEDWAAAWRTMSTLDMTSRAPGMQLPVLALSGKQDLSATPEVMQKIVEAYPNARLQSIDPGTHMMAMEQPDPVRTALAAFRDEIEQRYRLA